MSANYPAGVIDKDFDGPADDEDKEKCDNCGCMFFSKNGDEGLCQPCEQEFNSFEEEI